MTVAQNAVNSGNIFTSMESAFITYYKNENGISPTLVELKQHLVSHGSEKLVRVLKNTNSNIFNAMSAKELLATINLYIRKLRVW